VEGDPVTSLEMPLEMVLSRSMDRKYFGDENPIGKSLRFNGVVEIMITGVFEDVPRNSHLKPDFVVSWATMVQLCYPLFNQLTGEQLDYSLRHNPGFWITVMLIFIIGAFLSGIYPALFLSSFKPTTVFQGISELKVGGLGMRKVLVIFQFASSLLLIAGTLTVYRQISFMRNYDLGVDIEHALVIRGPSVNDSTYKETFNAFKSELTRLPEIEMVTASTAIPGRQPEWNTGGIRRLNEGPEQSNQYRIVGFDFNFVELYGLSILEGRNFSEEFGQNSETVLFKESAIQLMGFEDFTSALNVPIFFWGDTFKYCRACEGLSPGGTQGAT
jgi:putative ABC transport system permease protein